MNYAYANGTIKALENNLFDRSKYSKLIKTEKGEFIKTLIDLGYGKAAHATSLEELINSELLSVKELLDEISPQRKYTDLFFLSNDALNIKAIYKMKIFIVKHLDIFMDGGNLSKDALHLAIFQDDYSLLPKEYHQLFKIIDEKCEGLSNPRLVSAIVDNEIFEYIFKSIKNATEALNVYFKAYIDFANVLTFIRSRALNWSYDKFLEMFLNNGLIREEIFKEAYEQNNETVSRVFIDYYSDRVLRGLKTYFEKLDLNQLELYFDKLLIDIASEYKNDSFGIGPIIYFYLKKVAESKNIRIIYASTDFTITDLLE